MFRKLFSLLTIILMTTSPAVAQENEVAEECLYGHSHSEVIL